MYYLVSKHFTSISSFQLCARPARHALKHPCFTVKESMVLRRMVPQALARKGSPRAIGHIDPDSEPRVGLVKKTPSHPLSSGI